MGPSTRAGGRAPRGARFAGLLLCACAALPAQAMDEAGLAARLRTRLAGDRTGACIVAAVVEPTRVLRAGHCAAPRPAGEPGFDDAFEIGSVSKTMTAFLVADLVAAGRWTLDDPIAQHLPPGTRVPRQGEHQIRVRHLLTHSAALPPLPPRLRATGGDDPYAALTEQDLLASLAETTLQGEIGAAAHYSNFGMMVLSLAVARAYGSEFGGDLERALAARLFTPLQMTGAYIARPPAGTRAVTGHLSTGAAASPWTWAGAPNAAGVGGVRATLNDLVRYAQAQLGLLDTRAARALLPRLQATQQPLAHGFGMNWVVTRAANQDLVLHEGATGGFSALVVLAPAPQRAVVVLADTALADLGGLGGLGLALLDESRLVPAPRRAQPMPERLRQALPGAYTLAGLDVTIWAEAGRLFAQAAGQPKLELLADDHGDLYPAAGISALLTPVVEGERATRFVWRQLGAVLEGVRKGTERPATAEKAEWRPWAGVYRLTPQFSLRLFEDNGRFMLQGTGQQAFATEVTGPDRVEIKALDVRVDFQRNERGEVVGLTLRQRGMVLPGTRLPAAP